MDPYMQNYYNERSHIDKAFENWNAHTLGSGYAGLECRPASSVWRTTGHELVSGIYRCWL